MYRSSKRTLWVPGAAGALLLALTAGPALGEEGPRRGVVSAVQDDGKYVVIDGQRYRTEGRRVQPPREVDAEDQGARERPFRAGMIIEYVVKPGSGEVPRITRAWAVD